MKNQVSVTAEHDSKRHDTRAKTDENVFCDKEQNILQIASNMIFVESGRDFHWIFPTDVSFSLYFPTRIAFVLLMSSSFVHKT